MGFKSRWRQLVLFSLTPLPFNIGWAVGGWLPLYFYSLSCFSKQQSFPAVLLHEAIPLLFVDSLFSTSKPLTFAPPTKYRQSNSLSPKESFSLAKSSSDFLTFLWPQELEPWKKEKENSRWLHCIFRCIFLIRQIQSFTSALNDKTAACGKIEFQYFLQCSFLLLGWNERSRRACATWEAIKVAVGASCRTEPPGPRVAKWQRHFNSASVSPLGWGGEEVAKRVWW